VKTDAARRRALQEHVAALHRCTRCPRMQRPAVSGHAVLSRVLLVGQAPGVKEPVMGRPFAWTAGKTLFRWFHQALGWSEEEVRARIYFAAVCRCFPGKNPKGGDRVPDDDEIAECGAWLDAELRLLEPELVIPVGKLAIRQFAQFEKLDAVVGRRLVGQRAGLAFDVVPLPHPSGASTWHRMEPGRSLLGRALREIAAHPAMRGG
jgi:uracil-DNA glycosylase